MRSLPVLPVSAQRADLTDSVLQACSDFIAGKPVADTLRYRAVSEHNAHTRKNPP
jgi:tRNA dimethylallyltransferase